MISRAVPVGELTAEERLERILAPNSTTLGTSPPGSARRSPRRFAFRGYCLLVGLSLICLPGTTRAQHADVDISAVRAMYEVLAALKEGVSRDVAGAMLDSVLGTPPYQTMFRHYNRSWRPDHLPPSVFRQMILSVQFPAEYTAGENERADQMRPVWQRAYADLPTMLGNVRALEQIDLAARARAALDTAQAWLPAGWTIPDFPLIVIPSGGSRAFTIDQAQGYDFLQLPRDASGEISWDALLGTIAHESHHLGVAAHAPSLPEPARRSDAVAYQFLSMFVGEGTATKFIEAFPGGCVPSTAPDRIAPIYAEATAREWWQRLSGQRVELFQRFEQVFAGAYSGAISRDSLQAEAGGYWLVGFISPVYFVGAELYGAIYHGLGKEGLFAAMRDPREVPFLYNDAIRRRPDLLGDCPLLPDSLVQHARAIGRGPQ